MIHLSKEDLDKMSKEAREFGCAPSRNNYTGKESVIKVNPSKYGYRSAGGHVHLGASKTSDLGKCLRSETKLVVQILDYVLGNTCVMMDRDPSQIERRKVYGRAGEYRLPKHGLEYRTLSNFWIRSFQLMHMVYGFARLCSAIGFNIYRDEKRSYVDKGESDYRTFLKKVDKKDVERAINQNDFDLAKSNWDDMKDSLLDMIPKNWFGYAPISSEYLKEFEYFIDKGIDHWFKDDPLTHWTKNLKAISGVGWENFLHYVVRKDIKCKGKVAWHITRSGFVFDRT